MLKSLAVEDEGMQELINPVPLELIVDEDVGVDLQLEVEQLIASEDAAVQDVLGMLEDTIQILERVDIDQK